mmetsp:Transcript_22135/g.69419  ORF Transcript_22135/g.69419 Transcript_22135/m.69419 type:complete len:556 (-) Transcript_22135:5-1672(-)
MGGHPPDLCESQLHWGQRALETSRTQQTAFKDQWELIIENGNAHARAIAELKQDLEHLQAEVGLQKGELNSCSGSLSRFDRLIAQQTQRMIDTLQADVESNLAHLERRCKEEVKRLEDQLLGVVDVKLKQQQELWASQGQEAHCGSDAWANIKKEQYSHEVYIQDMLRRFGATIKEQDTRAAYTQEHIDRLEKELRAFMKEHDTGVVGGKDELRRFCTAIKAGLDARVTCLHERVGDFEKGLDAHVDWVQGELRQLHVRSQHDQEAQGASFREGAVRVRKDLDVHADWVQGELRHLNAAVKAAEDERSDARERETRLGHELNLHVDWVKAELRQLATSIKAEQDARAASSREWASRVEEQLDLQAGWVQNELSRVGAGPEEERDARGKCPEWTARFEKELDEHVGWVKGELRHLGASFKEMQDHVEGELRRRRETEEQVQRAERQEEGRRYSRLEGFLNEMDGRLLRLQDDLRGHWHKLSVTEHVKCGPAEPPEGTPARGQPKELERSPERTWEALGPDQRGDVQADDDIVIGSALFGSSPGRTEMPSVIESAGD